METTTKAAVPEMKVTTKNELIPITSVEQAALDAWNRVKTNAKKDRADWLIIGEFLAKLKAETTTDIQFGRRLKELGMNDIYRRARSDAIWMYQNATLCEILSHSVSHPSQVRREYNAYLKEQAADDDKKELKTYAEKVTKAAVVEQKDATRYAKLTARVADPSSVEAEKNKAQEQLDKIASKYESVEVVETAVDVKERGDQFNKLRESFRGAPLGENPAQYREKRIKERWSSILKPYVNVDDMQTVLDQLYAVLD